MQIYNIVRCSESRKSIPIRVDESFGVSCKPLVRVRVTVDVVHTNSTWRSWKKEAPYHTLKDLMSRIMTKPTKWVCTQLGLRSAWASAHSDQSLRRSAWASAQKTPRALSLSGEFLEVDQGEKWELNPMCSSLELGNAPFVLNHDHS